jgi:hypothetical protein
MQAIGSMYLHHVITIRKSEIDQLATGLGKLLTLARNYPDLFRPLFVHSDDGTGTMTPDAFMAIVKMDGVSARVVEYFSEYVRDEGMYTIYHYFSQPLILNGNFREENHIWVVASHFKSVFIEFL